MIIPGHFFQIISYGVDDKLTRVPTFHGSMSSKESKDIRDGHLCLNQSNKLQLQWGSMARSSWWSALTSRQTSKTPYLQPNGESWQIFSRVMLTEYPEPLTSTMYTIIPLDSKLFGSLAHSAYAFFHVKTRVTRSSYNSNHTLSGPQKGQTS